MERLMFRIKGMCCGEEITLLRKAVGPLVGGESNLSFDLLESKMVIVSEAVPANTESIKKAVADAGMEAVPWAEFCATGTCPVEESMWRQHSHLLLCLLSGVLIASGFLFQVLHFGGIIAALHQGEQVPAALPLSAILCYSGAVFSGGWFIAPKALFAARKLRPDMNLLMTLAVFGAMAIHQWFEAASVTFLFSLALLLESWSVGRARRAIKSLLDISPARARFICPVDGDIEEKAVEEVPVGVTVLVRPGEKIPLDGVITKGESSVNQAAITGESMPVFKKPGDQVFAGTLNAEGAIEFRCTRPATDTTLARIIHMVEEAQSRRAPTEQWVESFARFYTPAMIVLACLIAIIPPLAFSGKWTHWFYQALVILVIACPCSLVISTPVSIVAGLTSAARNGVLIKGGAYLEAPGKIEAMAFDKTGTLTLGHPRVQQVIPMGQHTEHELLARAAALESHSTHPLARAILNRTRSLNIPFDPAESFTVLPGQGAQGVIADKPFWIGSHRMLDTMNLETPALHEIAVQLEDAGHSLVTLWNDDHVCGLISIADEVRPEAESVVRALKGLGIKQVIMITGDNLKTARETASVTGMDACFAELLPQDKVQAVRDMRERYGRVIMIGDGVNDAPAMAEATTSIAMGAFGSDAAIETADIALMSDDLTKIPWLIEHSRRTLSIIKQNIFFSIGVKAVFIVLAAAGMATLWSAIAADMGASLLVIFNGLRLLNGNYRYPMTSH